MRIPPLPPSSANSKQWPKKPPEGAHFRLPQNACFPLKNDPVILQQAIHHLARKNKLPPSIYPELYQIMVSLLEGKSQQEIKGVIQQLVDTYLAHIKGQYHNPLVPFEQYAQLVKLQIENGSQDLLMRFMNGYKVVTKRS